MKKEIKLFDAIDEYGYANDRFKSIKELSYIARYLLPAYAQLFDMPHGFNKDTISSLENLAAFIIESGFPGKLETTILPEAMGGAVQFDTSFSVSEIPHNSWTMYHFCILDLDKKQPTIIRDIAIWILKFILEFTPVSYNPFEEVTGNTEEWLQDCDEEDRKIWEKTFFDIEMQIDRSGSLIHQLSKKDFDIDICDEYYDYLKTKSRHPQRKAYMKLIKKLRRFYDIIGGKEILFQSTGSYGTLNFSDLFTISMTDSDWVLNELSERLGQAEDEEMIAISITYNPDTDQYQIDTTDLFNIKYAMKLYSEFINLYYHE